MTYELPEALEVNGKEYAIRTDYRAVLTVLEAMNDPDLQDSEKALVAFQIIYEDFDEIPVADYEEAFKQIMWFIDNGEDNSDKPSSRSRMIDFEQDSKILILGSFPSVKSREQMFFYGHPQNRFWKVIQRLQLSAKTTLHKK